MTTELDLSVPSIVERYFSLVGYNRRMYLDKWHNSHIELFNKAKGSKSKHQAWEGGYRTHLEQCMEIATELYLKYNFKSKFTLESVIMVLYFHDIEKMWKYTTGLPEGFDKRQFYLEELPKHGIVFTEEEFNALHYIHGENEDYQDDRVMGELAGLCHAADVMSARCFYNDTYIGIKIST